MTELVPVPGKYDPQWTQLEYSAGGGRDDLGAETLGESILADLLPGINNQTRRARYYSFWAWALRDFILDKNAVHTQAGFYDWLRRREDTLVLAYLAHGCDSGAAGTEQGNRVWEGGQPASYPLDWKSLVSVDGGSYELYYRGVLLEMNIISRIEGSPHDGLTRPIGSSLADAYGQSVSGTQYVRRFLNATRLRKADIEDFAQHGCLCLVREHEDERRRLINAFFRFESQDLFAIKRLASLSFFLDVIAQSNGQPLYEDAFRTVLYFWSYGDHHAYIPEGNLLSPAQRWRIFQLRQYFVFALETFWSLFLHRIQTADLSGQEYLSWLLDELNLSELAQEYRLALTSTDAGVLTLREFYEAVRNTLPREALNPGPAALKISLNEWALANQIRQERSVLNVQLRAGNGLLMLALMYWRCQPWRDTPGSNYTSERYAAGRLPIASYLRHVEQAFVEGWTLARWLGWLHHRYLWLQHRRVTLEKLLYRGQETAKFEALDEELSGDESRVGLSRFRGRGVDWPKTNAPRFPSALSILTDLDVIKPSEYGYQLRRDGRSLLERFRTYSVPNWTEPQDDQAANDAEEPTGG